MFLSMFWDCSILFIWQVNLNVPLIIMLILSCLKPVSEPFKNLKKFCPLLLLSLDHVEL